MINIALVNGGYLPYMDIKKFIKIPLLWNRFSDFEIISHGCSLGEHFQNFSRMFDPTRNMALMNRGYLHCTDMKKFFKKIYSSETGGHILKLFHRNVPWMTLFKSCLQNFNLPINMALVNKAYLHHPITRQQILDSSKLKEFVNDNFEFDENGRKLSRRVENTVDKREIARYEQFLLFPQYFQKAFYPGASKGVIVWEWAIQAPPGWLSGERVRLMTWWLWVWSPVEATFLSNVFSPLTSAEACEKSSQWLWKEKLC